MDAIIKPLMVAFDSSVFATHISKLEHGTADEIRIARRMYLVIQSHICIPVLMSEHLLELCQNSRDINQRILWFDSLPCVAWVETADRRAGIGTTVDLVAHEARTKWAGAGTLNDVATSAGKRLFHFGTGRDVANYMRKLAKLPESERLARIERSRQVASLCHIDTSGVLDRRIRDLKQNISRPELSRWLDFKGKLAGQLSQQGDPRLRNASQVAAEFAASLGPVLQHLSTSKEDIITAILQYFGVDPAIITDEMTLADVSFLGTYGKVLELASEKLGADIPLTASDFPVETCPSQLLCRELDRIRRKHAKRAAGSDLIDVQLAALTPYVDLTFVDKRTQDYLLQLRRRFPALNAIMKRTEKVGDLDRIIGELTK